jgi:BlaI family transcriptional regulator, penicillinase repressor
MSTLTPGELAVMRLLWKHGEMKPAEIQEIFPQPMKNPALRSYLTILLNKRHVSRRKLGKAFVYKAITREKDVFQSTLSELVEAYCGGSIRSLMATLIRSEQISEEELRELQRLAEGKDASKAVPKRKRS